MNRREFLAGAGVAGVSALAGCLDALGFKRNSNTYAPPLVEDRPNAVYYPTHVEGMKSFGVASSGPYKCALTYSYPHRFWLVTTDRTNKVSIKPEDSVHLMPVVWHEETGIVPPGANPQIELALADGDESVPSVSPWPMLSQPMGVHFGDNVALPRNGNYTATVTTSFTATKRTGVLADAPESGTFEFEFTYLNERLRGISYRDLETQGARGAVEPMRMQMLPSTQLPRPDALPGTLLGTSMSGDARITVSQLDDATRFGGGESETYLAVSPRTPYNRYPLPLMSVSGTVHGTNRTVFEEFLTATLDPELGYHYGAVVPASDWRSVEVSFDSPPQISRHEGYETAFFDMSRVGLTR